MNDSPKAKRQCLDYQHVEKENFIRFQSPQQYAQVPYETNFNHHFSPPPKQELGHVDELFNWLDEGNMKSTNDVSSYNVHSDVFGFLTPTTMEMSFF